MIRHPDRSAFLIRALGALLVLAGALASRTPNGAVQGPAPAAAAPEPALARLVESARKSGTSALVVWKNGRTLLDERFDASPARMSIQSITKSVDALAIGSLIASGRIASLDVPAAQWIPAWAADAQKSRITIRMLMDHTSGLPDPADFFSAGAAGTAGRRRDLVARAVALPLEAEPGTHFLYSNPGIQCLAPIIAGTAGIPADRYIEQIIFKPLGITDWAWDHDDAGNVATPGGLWLAPADLLKLGRLMLQGGSWEGRSLIPAAWVKLVTLPSQALRPEYGLLWWRSGTGTYYAQGWQGQFLVVMPAAGIVAVRTRAIPPDPLKQGPEDEATSFLEFPRLIESL
jgi:CubicO group peptidase (beta-lactamase class C family)